MGIQMDAHQKAGACTMMIRLSVKMPALYSVVLTIWSVQEGRILWDVKCQIPVCLQKTPAHQFNRERTTNENPKDVSIHHTTIDFVTFDTKTEFKLENEAPCYFNALS